MLFSKAAEYGLIATIYIAKSDKPEGVDTLSKNLDISKSFLAKILQNLAKADILVSFKGAKGGFALGRNIEEISVLEIIKASDIGAGIVFSCTSDAKCCSKEGHHTSLCNLWPLLSKVQFRIDDLLKNTKLSDLINE